MTENQYYGIIVGDPFYDSPRTSIGRATGAHRIATLLRKHSMTVEVIDFFNSWTTAELEQFVLNFGKLDFLGISIGVGRLDPEKVTNFIEIVKKNYPNVRVMAGGSQVASSNLKSIDYYFRGFAEGAIEEIVKYIRTGKVNPFIIEKIVTHDSKNVIDFNKHFPTFNLSNLKTEHTKNDFIVPYETLAIETSRGCIYKCMFCSFPLTGKKKNDYIRDKEDIKTELLENYLKCGITTYIITDDTFNDNDVKVKMMMEITEELPFKPNYVCYARIDLLHRNLWTLDALVKMGVRAIFFGIESLSPITSKKIRKLFTGDELKNFLFYVRKTYPELHLTGSFIVGLPDESFEQMEENIIWAVENKIFDSIITFPLNIPVNNQVNYPSPFTDEWQNYGYEDMSMIEIKDFITQNQITGYYKNANFEYLKKHLILWKNKHMNFIEAEVFAERLRKRYEFANTLSAFACLSMNYTGIPLNSLLKNPKTSLDWDKIKYKAEEFVEVYKKKKLSLKF